MLQFLISFLKGSTLFFQEYLIAELQSRVRVRGALQEQLLGGTCSHQQTDSSQLSSPFLFPPCHFYSGWSTVCSIKSVMRCKWDANPSQRSGLLEGGYLMSAFKREPSPQEDTEKRKWVCVCLHVRVCACVPMCKRERGKRQHCWKSAGALIAAVEKCFWFILDIGAEWDLQYHRIAEKLSRRKIISSICPLYSSR